MAIKYICDHPECGAPALYVVHADNGADRHSCSNVHHLGVITHAKLTTMPLREPRTVETKEI